MPPLTWRAYDDASESFFNIYEKLEFAAVHRAFLRFLPPSGGQCLDVGAGSGRDSAALARRGYAVTAVEPSKKLLALARARHGSPTITWVCDALPKLEKVVSFRHRYDFILVSAVWMHIIPNRRLDSIKVLSKLLGPSGHIAISLRTGGSLGNRVSYPTSTEELIEHACLAGLQPAYIGRSTRDSLARADVRWTKVVLELRNVAD